MAPSHFVTLVAFAFVLPACDNQVDWLVVETEVSELCVVELPTEFSATPTDGVATHVLDGEELGLSLSDKFTTEMYLRGVGISTPSGVEDFDFVESLRVEVLAAGQDPVEILNYVGSEYKGSNWFVDSKSAVDIAQYFGAEDMQLVIEFQGALPDDTWTADLEVCIRARAAYRESVDIPTN